MNKPAAEWHCLKEYISPGVVIKKESQTINTRRYV